MFALLTRELGSQPFYFSYGDNTGFGQHADYVFGWKGNALQVGMDATNCFGARCKDMKTQTIDKAKACSVKAQVRENIDGCKFGLRLSLVNLLTGNRD
jgi:hypothetical protein